MKRRIYSLYFLLLLCNAPLSTPTLYAEDTIEALDEFDSLFDDSGDLTVDTESLRSCQSNEASFWITLLNYAKTDLNIDIAKIFDEDFYKFTHIPTYRNILNYPNNFIVSYQVPESEQITFHMFYNQFIRKNYTTDRSEQLSKYKVIYDDGRQLGSYINVENGTFLTLLEDAKKIPDSISPQLNKIKNINFPLIFTTLANAKLEQRRAGMLVHYYKEFNPKTFLEIKLPIFYEINNLNYTEDEKKLLRRELSDFFSTSSGSGSSVDYEMEFAKQHLIMDAFGTGTLDITLKHTIWETDNSTLQAGLSLFAPTDRRWVTGMYGTYFTPKDQQPVLRVCDIVNTDTGSLEKDALEKMETFFFGALDHLASAIFQCQMGYDNHLALALKVLPYWQINDRLQYDGVYILEYVLPHERPRFYINNQSDTTFSEQYDAIPSTPDANAQKKLRLLEEKLTERLFPRVFTTRVSPGFLFNTISNLQFTRNKWNYTIGYNAWYRSAEKLTNIQASADELQNLNICKATNESASQIKLFAKLHRTFETKKHDISFSMYGNATVWNNNTGHDFTIGVSFDKAF